MGLQNIHDECHLVHQDLHNGNVMVVLPAAAAAGASRFTDENLAGSKIKILDLGLASFRRSVASSTKPGTGTRRRRKASRRKTSTSIHFRTRGMSNARRGSFVPVEEMAGFRGIRPPEKFGAAKGEDGTVELRQESATCDAKADLWALGILVCEAVLLSPIEEWFSGDRSQLLSFGYSYDLQQAKLAEARERSPRFGGLLENLLQWDPRLRSSARGVLVELSTWVGASGAAGGADDALMEVERDAAVAERDVALATVARLEAQIALLRDELTSANTKKLL